MDKLIDILTKIENAGYRLSETKSELSKIEIEWIGRKLYQNGIKHLREKLFKVNELKKPENEKELKSHP